MKYKITFLLFYFFFLLSGNLSFAQNSETIRTKALQYFNAGNFTESLSTFEKIKDPQTLENTNINLWKKHIEDILKCNFNSQIILNTTLRIISIKTELLVHYGVFDSSTNQYVIPPVYDLINYGNYDINNGFIQVHKNNKTALFNFKGGIIIPFANHYIEVVQNGKFINTTTYNGIEPSAELKSSLYDSTGKLLVEDAKIIRNVSINHFIIKDSQNQFQLFDIDKKEIISEKFSQIATFSIYQPKTDFLLVEKENQSYNYYPDSRILKPNHDFDAIIDIYNYDSETLNIILNAKNSKENNSDAERYRLVKKNNKTGIYDILTQKLVIPTVYDSISSFGNGLKDNKWSNVIYEEPIEKIFTYGTQYADKKIGSVVFLKNTKYGLKALDGTLLLKPEYDEIESFEYIVIFRKGNLWGFLGRNKFFMKPQFDHIEDAYRSNRVDIYTKDSWKSYAYDAKKKKYYVYKKPKSSLRKNPPEFNEYIDFEETYYNPTLEITNKKIKSGDFYGLSDLSNNVIVPPVYTSILFLEKGKFSVTNEDDKKGIIDQNGKIVLPVEFEEITTPYKDFYYVKKSNGKTGLYNKSGKQIIPVQYLSVKPTFNNLFIAQKSNYNYGIINAQNQTIYPFVIYNEPKNETIFANNDSELFMVIYDPIKGKKDVCENSLLKIENNKASKMFEGYTVNDDGLMSKFCYIIYKNNRIGFFNAEDKKVFEPKYKSFIYQLYNSFPVIGRENDFWDEKINEDFSTAKFPYPIFDIIHNFYVYKINDKVGVLRENLNPANFTCFKMGKNFQYFDNQYALEYYPDATTKRPGLIGLDGKVFVDPDKYEDMHGYDAYIDPKRFDGKFTKADLTTIFLCSNTLDKDNKKIDFLSSNNQKLGETILPDNYEVQYFNTDGFIVFQKEKNVKVFDLKEGKIITENKAYGYSRDEKGGYYTYEDIENTPNKILASKFDKDFKLIAQEKINRIDLKNYKNTWYEELQNKKAINKETKYGLTDKATGVNIPVIYDSIFNTSKYNNRLFFAKKDNKVGIIDYKNKIISDFEYDAIHFIELYRDVNNRDNNRGYIHPPNDSFIFIVEKNKKKGLINAQLNSILPIEYDAIRIDGKLTSSAIIARKNKKSIVYNSNGSYQFAVECDSLKQNVRYGYFEIFKNGKQGLLDQNGKLIYDCIYDYVEKTNIEDVFIIRKESDQYITDHTGKIKSEAFKELKTIEEWSSKILYIKTKDKNDKEGIINSKLEKIIPNDYDEISKINFNYVFALKQGKHGVLDLKNNIVIPFLSEERINYDEQQRLFDYDIDKKEVKVTPYNVVVPNKTYSQIFD